MDDLDYLLKNLCSALEKDGTEDNIAHTLNIISVFYGEKTPADVYTDMIEAQTVLFGGTVSAVRKGIDTYMASAPDEEKAHYIAQEMRETLYQHLPVESAENLVAIRLYQMIMMDEVGNDRTWEYLFAAAAYHKTAGQDSKKTYLSSLFAQDIANGYDVPDDEIEEFAEQASKATHLAPKTPQ